MHHSNLPPQTDKPPGPKNQLMRAVHAPFLLLPHILQPPLRAKHLRIGPPRLRIPQDRRQRQRNDGARGDDAPVGEHVVLGPQLLLHGGDGRRVDAQHLAHDGHEVADVARVGVAEDGGGGACRGDARRGELGADALHDGGVAGDVEDGGAQGGGDCVGAGDAEGGGCVSCRRLS